MFPFFFQKAPSNKVTQKLPLKTPKNILFCYSSSTPEYLVKFQIMTSCPPCGSLTTQGSPFAAHGP